MNRASFCPDTAGRLAHYVPMARAANAESWQAWRLGERESDAIAIDAADLAGALAQAMAGACFYPKDRLAIQYTHAGRGKRTLWVYQVRKSAKRFTHRASLVGGDPVREGRLEPDLLFITELAADFAPVLRFDAFRDDAVGVDRQLVGVRS